MKKGITKSIKGLMTITLVLFMTSAYSQTKYTGYEYDLNTDDYYPFKYTREYKEEGDIFKTIYKIYHPTKGHHAFTVTATHYKSEKKVKVDVEDAGGGIFAHINDEETTYETPSMEAFGFRGSVGALGGNRVPNQLMVKFVSNKYENVKVVHINASEPGTSNFYFYVLDEKN